MQVRDLLQETKLCCRGPSSVADGLVAQQEMSITLPTPPSHCFLVLQPNCHSPPSLPHCCLILPTAALLLPLPTLSFLLQIGALLLHLYVFTFWGPPCLVFGSFLPLSAGAADPAGSRWPLGPLLPLWHCSHFWLPGSSPRSINWSVNNQAVTPGELRERSGCVLQGYQCCTCLLVHRRRAHHASHQRPMHVYAAHARS